MLLKFEIIWTRIGYVIRLQNINFSKIPCIGTKIPPQPMILNPFLSFSTKKFWPLLETEKLKK